MEKLMQRFFKASSITAERMVSPASAEIFVICCTAQAPCSNAGFIGMSTAERAISSDTMQQSSYE
jgi:hypothetical protein